MTIFANTFNLCSGIVLKVSNDKDRLKVKYIFRRHSFMFVEFLSGLFPSMLGATGQAVLWAIMVLGVFITFRLLNIADLTVDGSFAFGGCICVLMIVKYNINPILALLTAGIAGLFAGAVTGIIHTVFDIPSILAGILTQISLWSVNLALVGVSNISLNKAPNVFTAVSKLLNMSGPNAGANANLIVGFIAAALIIGLLYWFFGTELGSALRATGNNEDMIRALGFDVNRGKLIALMLSNGLVGLSGGLVAQSQKYADINMGTGAIVIGLAAIVIGEVLLSRYINFAVKLTAAVFGTIVYFWIRAIVLRLGLNANYMRLVSAIIVFIALAVPVILERMRVRKSYHADI